MSARHMIPPNDNELSRIKMMWSAGVPIGSIAKALGRSEPWVRKQSRQHCTPRSVPMKKRYHTDETIEVIRVAWASGADASTIGNTLGMTRNVVIGLVHRNKLKRSPEVALRGRQIAAIKASESRRERRRNHVHTAAKGPFVRKTLTRRDMAEALRPEPYLILPDEPPTVDSVENLEPHHCRWPIGEPGHPDFGYCGAKRYHTFSYCDKHVMRATATHPIPPRPAAANDSQPHNRIIEAAE